MNDIKNLKPPCNAKLISFDVQHLFSSIPVDELLISTKLINSTTEQSQDINHELMSAQYVPNKL